MKTPDFPRLLAAFFTDRLIQQLQASPHTIASYRDTFRLLVRHARKVLKKAPTELELGDLDTDFLGAFLSHLEDQRGNDARTRNTRLAAVRSFFGYVASHEPQHAALAQRVLAMPNKRHTRRPVDFLNRDEVEALLRAPDLRTRAGRRDRTLLLVAVQTGLRASELFGLRCRDVQLGAGAHLRCHGKGRKERCTPLRKDAAAALRNWLEELRGEPDTPVFPNQRGGSLSHDGLDYLFAKHLAVARAVCPSLKKKRVTPHVLRHTAAMDLLQNGVDRAVIALWLGHESVETTYVYLHADLKLKESAMAKTTPSQLPPNRYRPDDEVKLKESAMARSGVQLRAQVRPGGSGSRETSASRSSSGRTSSRERGLGTHYPRPRPVDQRRSETPGLLEQSVIIPRPMRHPTRAPPTLSNLLGIIRVPE